MVSVEAEVEPELLRWARTTAKLPPQAIADATGRDVEAIEAWERGDGRPTIAQLRKIARVCGRPFNVFFLAQPPDEQPLPKDLRRAAGSTSEVGPALVRALRSAIDRREIALELAETLGISLPDPPTLGPSASAKELAVAMTKLVSVSEEERQVWPSNQFAALADWRVAFERVGILVFQFPDVAPSECRGFALGQRPWPVIALNIRDSPRARVYTLFHELAHIVMGSEGICGQNPGAGADMSVERKCERAAAQATMPEARIRSTLTAFGLDGATDATILRRLYQIAGVLGVSQEAALRRLDELSLLGEENARKHLVLLMQNRYEATGKATWPNVYLARSGRRLPGMILDAYHQNRLSTLEAAELLGIKIPSIPVIETLVHNRDLEGPA